jgi:phage-related protein
MIPRVLLYDNIRSAVLERVGQAIHFNSTLLDLAAHYRFEPRPVAVGVEELRIRDDAGIYRTFYFTKSKRGILIPHACVKKTQKIQRHEIALVRKRLKEMRDEEQQIDHRA